MKKMCILILFAFLCATLSGCKSEDILQSEDVLQNEESRFYECFLTDYTLGESTELKIERKSLFPPNEKLEEYASVLALPVGDKVYATKYSHSGYDNYSFRRHYYDSNGVTSHEIVVNDDLQLVYYYNNTATRESSCEKTNKMTFSQAEKAAFEFAEKYIDTKEYVYNSKQVNEYPDHPLGLAIYYFNFSKTFDGFKTTDIFSVAYTSKGEFLSFGFGDLGKFDDLPPDLIDHEKLNATLLENARLAYEAYFDSEFTGEYKMISQLLMCTPGGEIILRNRISVAEGLYTHGVELSIILCQAPDAESAEKQ